MAVDLTLKRQRQAALAIAAADRLLAAIWELDQIRQTVAESGGDLVDENLEDATLGTSLAHLTAWQVNTLLNVVTPGLVAGLERHLDDNPAAATYRQILLAVRP